MVNNNLTLKSEIWVTKWVDFSNTFGLGYILNNGHIGLYFNDTTNECLYSCPTSKPKMTLIKKEDYY